MRGGGPVKREEVTGGFRKGKGLLFDQKSTLKISRPKGIWTCSMKQNDIDGYQGWVSFMEWQFLFFRKYISYKHSLDCVDCGVGLIWISCRLG